MPQTVTKDPGSIVDWALDWDADALLASGELISTSSWVISPAGELGTQNATKDNGTKQTSVEFTGGVDGKVYEAQNTITTDQGRTFVRRLYVRVQREEA